MSASNKNNKLARNAFLKRNCRLARPLPFPWLRRHSWKKTLMKGVIISVQLAVIGRDTALPLSVGRRSSDIVPRSNHSTLKHQRHRTHSMGAVDVKPFRHRTYRLRLGESSYTCFSERWPEFSFKHYESLGKKNKRKHYCRITQCHGIYLMRYVAF